MNQTLTTLTRLLIVQEIQEDTGGATLIFQEGRHGRLKVQDGNYAPCLRLARRSQERQHPVGVRFGEGQTIAGLMRADNDVPTKIWEEDRQGVNVLFQGHDGVFPLKRENPEFERLCALLGEAIGQKGRVWFTVQYPGLTLLDILPAGGGDGRHRQAPSGT